MNKQEMLRKTARAKVEAAAIAAGSIMFLAAAIFALLSPSAGIITSANRGLVVPILQALIGGNIIILMVIIPKAISRIHGLHCRGCGYLFPILEARTIIEKNECTQCGTMVHRSTGEDL